MKYHILHDFRTSTSSQEKFSDHIEAILHKLKLLTYFDVNMTSVPRGIMNGTLKVDREDHL